MLNKKGWFALSIIFLLIFLVVWFFFFKTSITGNVLEKTGEECIKSDHNNTKYQGNAKIDNRYEYEDRCVDTSTLKEYYCSDDKKNLYYNLVKCPCREGMCVPDVECVEKKNKLLVVYEKAETKFQYQDVCTQRGNQSILIKYRCDKFASYDLEEEPNWNDIEKTVKIEEPCYLSDQSCDPYTLECKYGMGINTEPKLSALPNKITIEDEEEKEIRITLIDINLPNEQKIASIFVTAPNYKKQLDKAVYYESDGLYRATYKLIKDECLNDVIHPCDPTAIPISSGELTISYQSNTGKIYATKVSVIKPQEETIIPQTTLQGSPEPVETIPASMELNELQNSLEKFKDLENYFILKGSNNLSILEVKNIGKSLEAKKLENNLFGIKLLKLIPEIKKECDLICNRFNSTSILDLKVQSFKNLTSNQLNPDDMCTCKCANTQDITLECPELVLRSMRKA